MKGILLAGGNGRRLGPVTRVTNKHLLPVYDRPMIYYPLELLTKAGIDDILIVSGKEHVGKMLELLGSGRDFGCKIHYEVQEEAGGIAQALSLAEKFTAGENMTVVLGDNIFNWDFSEDIKSFEGQIGARIFIKEVPDAKRFGVVDIDEDLNVLSIEEKPEVPKSNYAQTGLYMYDNQVFDIIRTLKPSGRGELEITDVNNRYRERGQLKAFTFEGEWIDAGTFEGLQEASALMRKKSLDSTKPLKVNEI